MLGRKQFGWSRWDVEGPWERDRMDLAVVVLDIPSYRRLVYIWLICSCYSLDLSFDFDWFGAAVLYVVRN